jgi:FixJ family two-component response regulator
LICLVDDDREVLESLGDLLRSAGYPSARFESAEAFLHSPEKNRCRCVVTDIEMPGMSGLDLAQALRAEGIRAPLIAVTAHARYKPADDQGPWSCFLTKPFVADELLGCVRQALRKGGRRTRRG